MWFWFIFPWWLEMLIYSFIYLIVLSLSFGTWNLQSSLQCEVSLVVASGIWASFQVPIGHLYVFFWKMFMSYTNLIIILVCYWILFFICFRYQPLIRYIICKYFLLFNRLSFCFIDGFLLVWCCHICLFLLLLPLLVETDLKK